MENYPPTMFQSSSSTLPQNNSHSSPPFNTAAMSSQHTPQDDHLINPNNTYVGLISTVENNTGADQTATMANNNNNNNIAITGSENGTKKTRRQGRYAFQTRSQVDILDDGYRWRKYGQKAVKNNKFPRSYYRCTHQGCNVKKQVQRLSKDEGIVVTTYVGMHSHAILESTDNFDHILSHMQIYTSS